MKKLFLYSIILLGIFSEGAVAAEAKSDSISKSSLEKSEIAAKTKSQTESKESAGEKNETESSTDTNAHYENTMPHGRAGML